VIISGYINSRRYNNIIVRVYIDIIPINKLPRKNKTINTSKPKKIKITGLCEPPLSIHTMDTITSINTVEEYKIEV